MTDIMTLRLHGEDDTSPMEMISRDRLAYYQRLEAAVALLVATLAEKPEE
ncbi:hypothetical protein [Massilia soli]|uniref:Uncharacterized protein n=1 Tax=Massilia soli TaxID=2792854 RepID=A0ABS7SR83_9BURK|nr:hypothetical protein [Massilia soli]MBZ2208458.1 hypothetical protein [Massilia soli]